MKFDEKLIIGAGIGLMLLAYKKKPIEGLGSSWSRQMKTNKAALDKLKKDSWIYIKSRREGVGHRNYRYFNVFELKPTLNTSEWTINAAHLKPIPKPSSGLRKNRLSSLAFRLGASKEPIILKAKSLSGLKKAMVSLNKAKAKAQKYAAMPVPPGVKGPTPATTKRAFRKTVTVPGSPGDWLVRPMAIAYIKIIDGALKKAESALKKAEAKKIEEDKKKAAMDALRDATKTPATTATFKPGNEPAGPVKNDWQELMRQAEARRRAAPAPRQAAPQTPMQAVQQRTAAAPVQASPDMEVNPVAAGAAAAVPLILAAVL
jgi:hypothetical protein